MTGSPQVMFPVGEEGGRLRCFQAALKEGKIEAEFPVLKCEKCGKQSVYGVCEECGSENKQLYFCNTCGILEKDVCDHGECRSFMKQSIDIRNYYKHALKMCKMNISPELVKGVRGTSNKDHVPENLSKGLLRAKHEIYVNKDGTVRFDMSEVPVTHFIPNEIGTSVERLKELGYENDTYGDKLENPDQVVEIKPQDVIIPAADGALDEQSNKVLVRVAKFIDDLLVNIYGLEPYYNVKSKNDLVGHLVLALAPHISAGMVGRIIGFSNTQGFFTHPMFHAALRRDCFSHDTYLPFFIKGRWEIKKIGKVIENLNPVDVVDSFGTKEVKISGVKTLGSNSIVNVNNFTKHSPQKFVRIKTASGKLIETTDNHKHVVFDKRKRIILAHNLKLGDKLGLPFKIDVPTKDINEFDLIDLLSDQEWVMVRGVNKYFNIKKYAKNYFSKKDYDNYTRRDSYPIEFIVNLKRKGLIFSDNLYVSAKRDNVKIPAKIKISNEFLRLVGLYVAEGYSRGIDGRLYQVYIAAQEKEIRSFVKVNMRNIFGLVHTENKKDRVTYSSRILYHLFICILGCGSSAYEKRLPSLFLNLPKYRIGHMLSGYFEGDGSVSKSDNRVTFDTVSRGLLKDLDFVFAQLGIFIKNYEYKSLPGKKVREFYIDKGRDVPEFIVVKGIIQSIFVKRFFKYVGFISSRKQGVLNYLAKKNPRGIMQEHDDLFIYDKIVSLRVLPEKESYCLNVNGNEVVANSILTRQCDGDEASISMLMDAVLNFSRNYLPTTRGASTMDAPLVLTSKLIPAEVDDQAHGLDVVWKYPLELYDAALEYKNPWEVKVEQLNSRLNKPEQYEGLGFTHDVSSINVGVSCSAYKSLPSMDEKLAGQMAIAEQVRAVNTGDVARLVIEKHFLKDTRGNLRKFSQQQFRCVKCNSKFRRPPLVGRCTKCSGKIIFTISEGSVVKYLDKSINLAENYDVPAYIKQSLDLLKRRVESMFGRDKEKQSGLGEFV